MCASPQFAAETRVDPAVSLRERLRRLFQSEDPDHPLSDEERHDQPAETVPDEAARIEEDYVGGDLDPDEPRSGRL